MPIVAGINFRRNVSNDLVGSGRGVRTRTRTVTGLKLRSISPASEPYLCEDVNVFIMGLFAKTCDMFALYTRVWG